MNGLYDGLIKEASMIIPNEELLVNTLIELSYNKSKITKAFAWYVGGEQILRCMLSKNENKIKYPVRDLEGDIVFDGEIFKMIEKVIEEEDE